jgi:hypothetical protein
VAAGAGGCGAAVSQSDWLIEVGAVSVVTGPISLEDSRAAGFASVEELLADLKKGPPLEAQIYRIELQPSNQQDARDGLAHDGLLTDTDLAQLSQKLAQLDAHKQWTMATLLAIEGRPGTRAADLAADLGWPELLPFKLHVRKLKSLGLTLSLRVGYRLAPRGEAYLRSTRERSAELHRQRRSQGSFD